MQSENVLVPSLHPSTSLESTPQPHPLPILTRRAYIQVPRTIKHRAHAAFKQWNLFMNVFWSHLKHQCGPDIPATFAQREGNRKLNRNITR